MAVPINLPSTTKNASLPLLFSGQAQKEFFLNQSLCVLDALVPRAVQQQTNAPPQTPEEGSCFLIGSDPTSDWAGRTNEIAIWIGGSWQYLSPQAGMQVFDRGSMSLLHYNSGWNAAPEPAIPTGGATVDTEARAAISDLVEALRMIGVFATSPA